MSEREPRDVLADAIASTSRSIDADGAMCTGWVVIAEWTGADGAYWVSRLADEATPRWRLKGLLRDALDDLSRPEVT